MGYIYKIVHKASGKSYIGSTHQTITRRWWQHKYELGHGQHHNVVLQRAWDKYGPDAFEWIILEEGIEDYDKLIELEQFHLDDTKAHGTVYNIADVIAAPFEGRTHSLETRRRLSEMFMGHSVSEEARRKMSVARKGRPSPLRGFRHTEETKRKVSEANGKPYSAFYKERTGKIIPAGINLSKMCVNKGLNCGAMWNVKAGVLRQYKGWIRLVDKDKPVIHGGTLPHPAFYNERTGETIPSGMGLKPLCRERGLNYGNMYAVKVGWNRSCKGWVLAQGQEIQLLLPLG